MDLEAEGLFAGKPAPTRIDGVLMIFKTEQDLWEILVKTPFTLLSKDIY